MILKKKAQKNWLKYMIIINRKKALIPLSYKPIETKVRDLKLGLSFAPVAKNIEIEER